MQGVRSTRGGGLLERSLACWRMRVASRLLADLPARERLLDIGCGTYPLFLVQAPFDECHGLDRSGIRDTAPLPEHLSLMHHDLEADAHLPYETGHFDAVTMLALAEHLSPATLQAVLCEAYRVLRPEGALVLTTPSPLSHRLLGILARAGLVSRDEIDEHQEVYSQQRLREMLGQAGFPERSVDAGSFECGLNLWIRARRPD